MSSDLVSNLPAVLGRWRARLIRFNTIEKAYSLRSKKALIEANQGGSSVAFRDSDGFRPVAGLPTRRRIEPHQPWVGRGITLVTILAWLADYVKCRVVHRRQNRATTSVSTCWLKKFECKVY